MTSFQVWQEYLVTCIYPSIELFLSRKMEGTVRILWVFAAVITNTSIFYEATLCKVHIFADLSEKRHCSSGYVAGSTLPTHFRATALTNNKTGNVRLKETLKHFRVTTVAVEK